MDKVAMMPGGPRFAQEAELLRRLKPPVLVDARVRILQVARNGHTRCVIVFRRAFP